MELSSSSIPITSYSVRIVQPPPLEFSNYCQPPHLMIEFIFHSYNFLSRRSLPTSTFRILIFTATLFTSSLVLKVAGSLNRFPIGRCWSYWCSSMIDVNSLSDGCRFLISFINGSRLSWSSSISFSIVHLFFWEFFSIERVLLGIWCSFWLLDRNTNSRWWKVGRY